VKLKMAKEEFLEEFRFRDINLSMDEVKILKNRFSKNVDVLQINQDTYRISARQYVGNIVLPDHILIIKPKIENLNFFRMLFSTYNLEPKFENEKFAYPKEKAIFELIVDRFLYTIERLTKRGFSKGYVEEEDNLNFAKGRILIKEDLKHNLILHHKLFCQYSDFTSDTLENRIAKYTLYHLSRIRLESRTLQKRVRQAIHFFEQVSFVHISSKKFPKIQYTRMNEHYRPIMVLSEIIIQNSTLNLQKSGEVRYSSFLVDMNRLFENFLLGYLKKNLKEFSVRGMGHEMYDYDLDLRGQMTQKPDIVIQKNGADVLVIDAKYKRLETKRRKQIEIITSDARQVWSYCLVPKTKLPFGVLVYPKHLLVEEVNDRYKMKNGVTLILQTIDLSKEDANDFANECERFARVMLRLIELEVNLTG
jgi:5-methylcytosine-specific restriction enzyme subunit McrC